VRYHQFIAILKICLLGLVLIGLAPGKSVADPPAAGDDAAKNKVRPAEITEMLLAIFKGSQMGPGDGWFKGGQSRYSWDWLAAHFDADQDGIITREEFQGPSYLFDRLDINHDGVVTKEDFNWSQFSMLGRQMMIAGQWFRRIDSNSNGRISKEEWETFFARFAKGKEYLTPDDLREAFPMVPPARPPQPKNAPKEMAAEGPSPLTLISGLLSGELGSFHEGPAIDAPAPDFSLKTQDGQQQVTLSSFRGKKPVVLVFGSFT
jgi:Ca2+-binding EF-hand superfamily protein